MRFPGFEGEWEVKKLGEITSWSSGGTPPKDNPLFWNGDITWISASSMKGLVYSNSELKITQAGLKKGSKLASKGSLLILVRGSMLFNKIPIGIVSKDVAFNQDVKSIVVNDCSTSEYILNWFISSEPKILNMVTGTGIGAGKLDLQDLKELEIKIPSIPEQIKITSFLSIIDERIQTQNKIIEQLETLIKGLCQEIILSQTPNRKLKDCVSCYSSSLTELDVIGEKGTYPVYGATGIIAFISKYQINEDAILIIKDGSGVGKVHYATDKLSVIGTLNYLIVKPTISLKYIFYCLKFFNFKKYKVGSSIPHIYFKDYGKSFIYCPSFDEQQKIEKLLSSIDEKINVENILLKKYKIQKKYLLQNLFI